MKLTYEKWLFTERYVFIMFLNIWKIYKRVFARWYTIFPIAFLQ